MTRLSSSQRAVVREAVGAMLRSLTRNERTRRINPYRLLDAARSVVEDSLGEHTLVDVWEDADLELDAAGDPVLLRMLSKPARVVRR